MRNQGHNTSILIRSNLHAMTPQQKHVVEQFYNFCVANCCVLSKLPFKLNHDLIEFMK